MVGWLECISIFWDLFGVVIVSVVLLAVAPTHQSPQFVFTTFLTDQAPGVSSRPYIFLLGLLSSAFTLVGKTRQKRTSGRNSKSSGRAVGQ